MKQCGTHFDVGAVRAQRGADAQPADRGDARASSPATIDAIEWAAFDRGPPRRTRVRRRARVHMDSHSVRPVPPTRSHVAVARRRCVPTARRTGLRRGGRARAHPERPRRRAGPRVAAPVIGLRRTGRDGESAGENMSARGPRSCRGRRRRRTTSTPSPPPQVRELDEGAAQGRHRRRGQDAAAQAEHV